MKLNINNTRFIFSSRQTGLVLESKLSDYFIIRTDSPNFPENFLFIFKCIFTVTLITYFFQGNSVVGFESESNICIFFALSVVFSIWRWAKICLCCVESNYSHWHNNQDPVQGKIFSFAIAISSVLYIINADKFKLS